MNNIEGFYCKQQKVFHRGINCIVNSREEGSCSTRHPLHCIIATGINFLIPRDTQKHRRIIVKSERVHRQPEGIYRRGVKCVAKKNRRLKGEVLQIGE